MICQWDFCVFSHLGLTAALVGKNGFKSMKETGFTFSVSALFKY